MMEGVGAKVAKLAAKIQQLAEESQDGAEGEGVLAGEPVKSVKARGHQVIIYHDDDEWDLLEGARASTGKSKNALYKDALSAYVKKLTRDRSRSGRNEG